MDQLASSDRYPVRGFTLIELLVATIVLMVGLVAVAGVVGSALSNTSRSEFMTQAATLATEKLEDLNRYPPSDANVSVPNGTSAGNLSADTAGYFDEVYFSPTQGAIDETTTSLDSNGNLQYQTTTYTPDGHMSAPATSSTPPSATSSAVFDRRWLIELNQPVTGVRRVTVLVTLLGQFSQTPVSFQMSMVRP